MPSGIISPSEIPDSPSQTMPQSPRQKVADDHASPSFGTNMRVHNPDTPRRLPFEDETRDEVTTFGVENTPAVISHATSLSNLSIDDEPKITNDSLIKEMRLMHQLSDEQQDQEIPQTSAYPQANAQSNQVNDEQVIDDGDDILSDTDESVNNSMLLADCISIGIQAGARAKHIETGNYTLWFSKRL